MKSIKELPPHVAANVGPMGLPTGQSQTAIGLVLVLAVTKIGKKLYSISL